MNDSVKYTKRTGLFEELYAEYNEGAISYSTYLVLVEKIKNGDEGLLRKSLQQIIIMSFS